MKALILAAGRSKRIAPIRDKNFLDFFGKPLLQHQIEALIRNGFKDLVVIGGKHNLQNIKELAKKVGKNISVIEQKDLELGMCGAVLSARSLIKNEPILIISSNDVVDDEAFKLILKSYKAGNADSYLLGKKVDTYFPGGYLKIGKNGFIQEIVEKPGEGKEPSNLVNLVVHIHQNSKKLIENLEKVKSKNDDKYEVALSNMIKDGLKVKAVKYEGFWQPIKYPWHVLNVFNQYFDGMKKSIDRSAKIAKNAIINGKVVIGKNVRIFDGAVINGPAYIGNNSIVATNALVRESYVGHGCIIGFSTEVARSYLQSNVWTHTNYIGDSIICNNVSFGSGAVTGNLRLDEKNIYVEVDGSRVDTRTNKFGLICGENVRVGINTSLMPGIKIGANSFIGAGIIVPENIPENSYVRGSWDLKISKNLIKLDEKNREEMKKKLS